jgi:hypothetical protein
MSKKLAKKSLKVWSDTLNEENLCENLFGTNLLQEKKLNNQRGVESYDFESDTHDQAKQRISNRPSGCDLKNIPKNHLFAAQSLGKASTTTQSETLKQPEDNRGSIKDRLGSKVTFSEVKPRSHIKATDLDSDDLVAKEITKHLREPKDDIIRKNFFY